MKKVAVIKTMQLMITKRKALLAEMMPLGISLMAVLGFFASNCLSK